MYKHIKILSLVGLLTPLFSFAANALQLNGIATHEQLRKEFYIGALYLETPTHDAAAIASLAGSKRMVLRITADRWSPMQYAQQWNQMILINNGGSALNANVMDVLNFTSIPKGDLVAGDEMTIEVDHGATLVNLNGTTVMRASSTNLFNLLLSTWVGARPPSTEFKRDILNLPQDKNGTDTITRFESIKPSEARRKVTATWGAKDTAQAEALAAAAAKPKPTEPAVVEQKATAETKKNVTTPTPQPAAKPAAAAATSIAAATPVAIEAKSEPAAAVDEASEKAKAAHQRALYDEYSGYLRRLVLKNIVYPKRAIKQNQEGLVVVRASVNRSGDLIESSIAQSAEESLDRAALDAVKKALPLPALSSEMDKSQYEFMIPVVFKLN